MDSSAPVVVSSPAPGVRLVTLNRPRIHNAMTEDMTAAYLEAWAGIEADTGVRVAIVTGAGASFCSGADLSWLDSGGDTRTTADQIRGRMLPFYNAWLTPRRLPIPVIAAVNGAAIGAGLCAALACDIRFAAPSAQFSAPFNLLGTHGGMGVTYLLPEAVGIARAREMLYTGRSVTSAQAEQWGLVNESVPHVVDHAIAVASRIASAAPIATRLTKAGLEQSANGLAAALQWEGLAQPLTMASADLHEGIAARREHRQPRFTGE